MSKAPCEWTIVRVYPDPIAGERVNIGVIVIHEETAYERYLRNWDRVEAFTGTRQWISDYAMACDHDPDGIRWLAANGNGDLRYDTIQPSMDTDPQALLARLACTYLKDGDA